MKILPQMFRTMQRIKTMPDRESSEPVFFCATEVLNPSTHLNQTSTVGVVPTVQSFGSRGLCRTKSNFFQSTVQQSSVLCKLYFNLWCHGGPLAAHHQQVYRTGDSFFCPTLRLHKTTWAKCNKRAALRPKDILTSNSFFTKHWSCSALFLTESLTSKVAVHAGEM